MEMILYPKQTEKQAWSTPCGRPSRPWRRTGRRCVAESFKWYERLPVLTVPAPIVDRRFPLRSGTAAGQHLEPAGASCRQPWYTLCRPHTNEPYGWWSYGMHGHEHLSTFVVNLTEPTLSQSFLRGHFQNQQPDGRIPVRRQPSRRQRPHAATWPPAPFLAWEAWTAYLWSGDRQFLRRGVRCRARGPSVGGGRRLARARDARSSTGRTSSKPSATTATWPPGRPPARPRTRKPWISTAICSTKSERWRRWPANWAGLTRPPNGRPTPRSGPRPCASTSGMPRIGVYYGRDIAGGRWARDHGHLDVLPALVRPGHARAGAARSSVCCTTRTPSAPTIPWPRWRSSTCPRSSRASGTGAGPTGWR